MKAIKQAIKNLQSKPYQTRIKILWFCVIVAIIAIIIIWFISLQLRTNTNDHKQLKIEHKLNELWENIKHEKEALNSNSK